MSIKTRILDGLGRGTEARIEDDALLITQYPCPPLLPQKNRVFRQYMTDDGLSTGGWDMQVVGSAAVPLQFWIPADDTDDRYITAISFVIADQLASLNEFGHIAALVNGCRLFYESLEVEVEIHGMLQTNFDFVRLCLGQPAFGTAADTFRAPNIVGLSEAFLPVLYLKDLMPPYGIKLDRGTRERLVLEVRDDTTGVDGFNAIAYGFDRFP